MGIDARDSKLNNNLILRIDELMQEIKKYRISHNENSIKYGVALLKNIINENKDLGKFFVDSVKEVVDLLEDYKNINAEKIANMPNFSKAWSRGQQYMCFKRMK